MELKAKIESVVNKIKSDKGLKEKFLRDPVKTLESLLGVDLPDEQLEGLVKIVRNKVEDADLDDKAEELLEKLNGRLGNLLNRTDLDEKLMDRAKKLFSDKD